MDDDTLVYAFYFIVCSVCVFFLVIVFIGSVLVCVCVIIVISSGFIMLA